MPPCQHHWWVSRDLASNGPPPDHLCQGRDPRASSVPRPLMAPYRASPSRGCPMWASCARIWCVRPVMRRMSLSNANGPISPAARPVSWTSRTWPMEGRDARLNFRANMSFQGMHACTCNTWSSARCVPSVALSSTAECAGSPTSRRPSAGGRIANR